jgi:hypothetical protein
MKQATHPIYCRVKNEWSRTSTPYVLMACTKLASLCFTITLGMQVYSIITFRIFSVEEVKMEDTPVLKSQCEIKVHVR